MYKILTLVATILIFSSSFAQKVNLSLHLEKGKEYNQVMNANASVIQEINGQKMDMKMTIIGGMTYKVLNVNDSDYDLEVKYDSMKMKMQMPMGAMEFSSENASEQDIFSTILSKMTGKAFEMKMDPTGKILEVKNIESMINSVINGFAGIPESQKAQAVSQLNQAWGKDAFKGNIEMATAIFPDNDVKIGDTWTIESEMEAGMPASIKTQYELTGANSETATIKGKSEIKSKEGESSIQPNGMSTKYDMEGTMLSDIKVDRKTGWIIEAKIHQEIKGEAQIEGNEQMPEGMTLPMTMINDMTITD